MNINKTKNLIKIISYLELADGVYLEKNKISKKTNYKFEKLETLKLEVIKCKKCELHKTRTNVVFGEGDENARLMFIGEGPGYEEDKQGRPFVGKAGELLNKIIQAMGLKRENVYIANIVKCHPVKVPDPNLRNNDRAPTSEEINSCFEYLKKQIQIISPEVICCLGSISAKVITQNDIPISELRGKIFDYKIENLNIKVVPTYHPAAVLRNPSLKPIVWKDMKLIMKILNLSI